MIKQNSSTVVVLTEARNHSAPQLVSNLQSLLPEYKLLNGREPKRNRGGTCVLVHESLLVGDFSKTEVITAKAHEDMVIFRLLPRGARARPTTMFGFYGISNGSSDERASIAQWDAFRADVDKYRGKGDMIWVGDFNVNVGAPVTDLEREHLGDHLERCCCGRRSAHSGRFMQL